jgi:hypothetical protein
MRMMSMPCMRPRKRGKGCKLLSQMIWQIRKSLQLCRGKRGFSWSPATLRTVHHTPTTLTLTCSMLAIMRGHGRRERGRNSSARRDVSSEPERKPRATVSHSQAQRS